MGWRRDTAQGRASISGLGVGRTTITLCLSLRMGVPSAQGWAGVTGSAAMAGEGILEGWPGWEQRVYLSRHQKDFRVTTSASSQAQSTVQDKVPSVGPESSSCPPPLPAPRAGSRAAPSLPSFVACLESTLRKCPSPCCCSSSGWQGGSPGFGLLFIPLLGPHWSAFARSLQDPASPCCSVGKPCGAAQRTHCSSGAPMSQSLHSLRLGQHSGPLPCHHWRLGPGLARHLLLSTPHSLPEVPSFPCPVSSQMASSVRRPVLPAPAWPLWPAQGHPEG